MSAAVPPIALLDASTLYPAALRNLLMRLAGRVDGGACARSPGTPETNRPHPRAYGNPHRRCRSDRLRDTLTLPDPDDRHVLAAAIHGGASVIVTVNLRDFPAEALASYPLIAQHPDSFVLSLLAADPDAVLAVMREHRLSLVNPPKTAENYIATLELHLMTATAAALRAMIDRL